MTLILSTRLLSGARDQGLEPSYSAASDSDVEQGEVVSARLVRWETPRRCRGGSQSLTDPAVRCWEIDHDVHS
jgi:hypothetical protein